LRGCVARSVAGMARHDDSVWGVEPAARAGVRAARASRRVGPRGLRAAGGGPFGAPSRGPRAPCTRTRGRHGSARRGRPRRADGPSPGSWRRRAGGCWPTRASGTRRGGWRWWPCAPTAASRERRRRCRRRTGSRGVPALVGAGDCFALAWAGIADREANAVGLSFAVIDAGGPGACAGPAPRRDGHARVRGARGVQRSALRVCGAPPSTKDGPWPSRCGRPTARWWPIARFGADTSAVAVSALGASWLVTVATHDYDTLRSRLAVSQLSASGEVLGTAGLAAFEGAHAPPRGAASRRDDHGVVGTGRRARVAAHALLRAASGGARRRGAARARFAAEQLGAGTWCVRRRGLHRHVGDGRCGARRARPEWMLERRDAAGACGDRAVAPAVSGRGQLERRAFPGRAGAMAGAMLAALAVHRRDASEAAGVLAQRLDGEGRPQGAPVRLPLP
jgi:hypothetical protein